MINSYNHNLNTFRCAPELKAEIEKLAEVLGMNYSQAIRWLLVMALENVRTRGSE